MASLPLISLQEITKGFREQPLFAGLSLVISEGERLALIGDNGSGKSTLLKIMARLEDVDDGVVSVRKGLLSAYVPQQESFPAGATVAEAIESHLAPLGLPHAEAARRVSTTLGLAGFVDSEQLAESLSGGWRKRLAIAAGLALEPDCLLLDEPTNHLDIESIDWLENLLESQRCAVVFVSHDRYFIERLAQRVVEINRRYPRHHMASDGSYSDFLERREEVLLQLEQQRRSLANKVRREVEWLRQGVKARTTKSRARISEAHRLIGQLKGTSAGEASRAELEFSSTQRKTKELIKVEGISQSIGGTKLFSGVSLVLSPGSRLAVVGPNGSGKTTFISTILGLLPPQAGRVVRAPGLRTVFMDQARTGLEDGKTLKEFLCPHGDSVVFRGEPIHVAAWAARFLFSRDHLALSVGALSGGERARALLAKSMAEACDVLLFDEPTNDLDIATLENLEDGFDSFPGAIVLITHDRYLLERSGSAVLGLHDGTAALFGGYSQWEESLSARKRRPSGQPPAAREAKAAPAPDTRQPKKLSYKDARELSMIEGRIEAAEKELEAIKGDIESGDHASNAARLSELCSQLTDKQAEVEQLYARWQELEIMQRSLSKGSQ